MMSSERVIPKSNTHILPVIGVRDISCRLVCLFSRTKELHKAQLVVLKVKQLSAVYSEIFPGWLWSASFQKTYLVHS